MLFYPPYTHVPKGVAISSNCTEWKSTIPLIQSDSPPPFKKSGGEGRQVPKLAPLDCMVFSYDQHESCVDLMVAPRIYLYVCGLLEGRNVRGTIEKL